MTVRSLSRGLKILSRLSTIDGLSINEVARQLNLPRGTSHRLLKTLEADGYVRLSQTDNRYRITEVAYTLGRPGDWEAWVNDIAVPLMNEFTREHLWPVGIATLYGFNMISRASSDRLSPFALRYYRRGFVTSLLNSSPGLAFLAYCDANIRDVLVKQMMATRSAENPLPVLDHLDERLEGIRKQGFAISPIRFDGESAYAIPVFVGEELLCCLSLRYIVSAKSLDDILEETFEPLKALRDKLAHDVEKFDHAPGRPPPVAAPPQISTEES